MTDNRTPDAQMVAKIQSAAAAAATPAVVVVPTLSDATKRACEDTMRILAEAVAARGVAHLALTGGSGGIALADALAPLIAAQPEPVRRAIHLWFGDERFVPVATRSVTTCWPRPSSPRASGSLRRTGWLLRTRSVVWMRRQPA